MRFGPDQVARPIGLAAGVLRECSAVETTRAAVGSGFDAVGFWVEPDWTAQRTREVRAILDGGGIAPMDVEVIWIKPGPLDPDHLRLIDVGAALGAPNALAVSSDPDSGATAAKLAALVEHGMAADVAVSLEFARFTAVHSLAAALVIAESAGANVLVDPLHLDRSGGTPDEVRAVPRDRLRYAQFCDAPATGPGLATDAILAEALDGRLQAGDGGLPLIDLLDALPPRLPLSIELRSRVLRQDFPYPADRARAVARRTRAFLAKADGAKAR